MNTFRDTKEKTIIKVIEEEIVKFRYPKFSDKIAIEASITLLTRGQFNSLAMSIFQQQKDASDYAEMISTLEICSEVLTKKNEVDENFSWRNLDPYEPDHSKFIKKCFDEFVSWRDSFRRTEPEKDKEDSKTES